MVDIQSVTAENRQEKKIRKKEEQTTGRKYNGLPITTWAAMMNGDGKRCQKILDFFFYKVHVLCISMQFTVPAAAATV